MPNGAIHSRFSTNWKSGVAVSKFTHSSSDSAKVISEVHSATARALRATTASSPRTSMMNTAPTSGRKVTSERIGQVAVMAQPIPSNAAICGRKRYHVVISTTPISIAKA
jgi:hypothetical protein